MKTDAPTPDIHDLAGRKKLTLRQVMDFTTTVNPLGPSAKTKNALRKGLKILHHYPDRHARRLAGLIALREGVPEENVLVCGSLKSLAAAIFSAFHVRGVLFPSPYPSYYGQFLLPDAPGAGFSPLNGKDGFTMDINRWIRDMAGFDAAVIPSPFFVSAQALSPEELGEIAEAARSGGTLLVIDESLREYRGQSSLAQEAARTDRRLIIRSLTEYYSLAGLPVSYAIGEAKTLEHVRQHASVTVPDTLSQNAAMTALKDMAYPGRTRVFMKRERSFIEENLRRIDGVSFFMTCCGFFVVSLKRPPSKPMETFLRYGIIVDELEAGRNERFMFLPVKDHKWNARYLKTLKNIMGAPQK